MAKVNLKNIVNPKVIEWARGCAQMDLGIASGKLGISVERLANWESGAESPTMPQLRKIANLYKRSVSVFFLDNVPTNQHTRRDFRRLELSVSEAMSPVLAATFRNAEAKRESALEILAEMEEAPPQFSLQINPSLEAEEFAERLAAQLGVTQTNRAEWKDEYQALTGWKDVVESLGVIVLQARGVALSEMRGACIYDPILPVILLNSKDSPLGRVFSLLHELTHLARYESSLCDVNEQFDRSIDAQRIEVFCNHVAGAVLVPETDLMGYVSRSGLEKVTIWEEAQVRNARRFFWASKEVIVRRLLITKKVSQEFYQQKRLEYGAENEARTSGGPVPQPRLILNSNGRFLSRLVVDAYRAEAITGTVVSRTLGTKLDHLPGVVQLLNGSSLF